MVYSGMKTNAPRNIETDNDPDGTCRLEVTMTGCGNFNGCGRADCLLCNPKTLEEVIDALCLLHDEHDAAEAEEDARRVADLRTRIYDLTEERDRLKRLIRMANNG